MARPLRLQYENAWYHVMNRGANKQSIFKNNQHRNLFCSLLAKITDDFDIEIHAFCLMSNHYHLLVKTPNGNLSKAMRHLNGVYTQQFNQIENRDGTLFRGRYKSILIDSNEYLLGVSRYIHLNPIEAKICLDPLDYKWSSFRAYAKKNCAISWLKTAAILSLVDENKGRHAYKKFVSQGLDDAVRNFYEKEQLPSILGDKYFIENQLRKINHPESYLTDINRTKLTPSKEHILNCVRKYFHTTHEDLIKNQQGKENIKKMIAIYLLRKKGKISHTEIAAVFSNIKSKSISALLNRAIKKLSSKKDLQTHLTALTKLIDEV